MRALFPCVVFGAVVAACSPKASEQPAPNAAARTAAAPAGEPVVPGLAGKTDAPAGTYTLDKAHSTLVFRLSHLGFSRFTAQFRKLDGELTFDPARPEAIRVTANIDPTSLELPPPPAGFREDLLGKTWLDAARYPAITFRAAKVVRTGPDTAEVVGDLTLHGVTKPITLAVKFNGGYPANAMDGARIGFSAEGAFRRSDFGIGYGLPAPGTNLGVGDNVAVTLETEWNSGKPTGK